MVNSLFPKSATARVLAIISIAIFIVLASIGGYALINHNDPKVINNFYFLGIGSDKPKGHADAITLAAPATSGSPDTTDGVLITHLTLTGGTPGKTDLEIRLTDMKGRLLPINGGYGVQLSATNLNTGATIASRDLDASESATTPTFSTDDPGFEENGWWRITTTVSRPDGAPVSSAFYVILPDPNLAGFEAPETVDNDPDAAKKLESALTQMGEWTSIRWWEWLSGGNDSLIMARYAVTTTDANGQPPSFQSDMLFAGGFERKNDGAPPPAPSMNNYSAVTIGDQAWNRNAEGEVSEMSPVMYQPIAKYPETYAGAISIQSGIADDVDGQAAHIVSFHVPGRSGQAEAWFAFWIADDTGDILKLAMVANNHYMVWLYSDASADFVITPPAGASPIATPLASPVATPTT